MPRDICKGGGNACRTCQFTGMEWLATIRYEFLLIPLPVQTAFVILDEVIKVVNRRG